MKLRERITSFFSRLISVSSIDSDDARRRQLLNIILLGVIVLTVILFLIFMIYVLWQVQGVTSEDMQAIPYIAAGLLAGTAVIYFLNKRVRGGIASTVFLVFLVVIFNFSDTPDQLADGRSLVLFSIPIVMASILLRPYMSFVFAGIVSVNIVILALYYGSAPNFPAITVFFLLALVSWLSARSLVHALGDLRRTNTNLDRLVQERTQELADALVRERVDSARTKAILESISDGVIVFNLHGRVRDFNPAIVRLLDVTTSELEESTIERFTQSRALDARNRGILAGLLANPGQQAISYRINWKKKTLSVSSSRVFDSEQNRIGTVAVFRDFTREAEVEKMKSTFMAVVSHELRTPLSAIMGYAEMLKESIYGPINEKQVRISERIMSNTHRLLGIVSDLLDQTQMEAGRLTIQSAPFKPSELLTNVRGVMENIASEKGLKLSSSLDANLPEWITGDQARLQQILINLINNAIKFTRQGTVDFRLQRHDKKHWALQVQDTGIGIPESELPLIFETFHQVDASASREHAGFGLGLSIVKQLTSLMGGDVSVTSELGNGSTFTVVLPLVTPRKRVAP